MYDAPPIIRHAEAFMRDIEVAVLKFPKRHQHVAGQELRKGAFKVAQLANRAWRRPSAQAELVAELSDAVDDLKLNMSLASGLRAFASFEQFEKLSRDLSQLGREVGGKIRQLQHPKGQNGRSRATNQRAMTLSTSSASISEAKP